MQVQLSFFILLICLFGCEISIHKKASENQETTTNEHSYEVIDSSKAFENGEIVENIIERYFPNEILIETFDTIIQTENIKISIQSKTMESFVTNTFNSDGKTFVDKYRDTKQHLTIVRNNQILLDTLLIKECFISNVDQAFLNVSTLQGYWFNRFSKNEIEFFGGINKPETDWSFMFYHKLDLNSLEFTVVELDE